MYNNRKEKEAHIISKYVDKTFLRKDLTIDQRKTEWDLKSVLAHYAGRESFRNYLKGEFSLENLTFWEAAELLEQEPTPSNKANNSSNNNNSNRSFTGLIPDNEVPQRIREIYDHYISPERAKEQVNLPDNIMKKMVASGQEVAAGVTNRMFFSDARKNIFSLMEIDSWKRYSASDHYTLFLQRIKEDALGLVSLFYLWFLYIYNLVIPFPYNP